MPLRYALYLSIVFLTVSPVRAFGENHFVLFISGSLGEGTPVLTSTGFPIALYRDPDENSGLLKFMSVPKGEEFRVKESDCAVIIRKSGAVQVLRTTSVKGESYGDVTSIEPGVSSRKKNFTLPEGSRMEYLTLTGDDRCLIKVLNEIVLLNDCDWTDSDSEGHSLSMEEKSSVEWWVKIKEGWVRIDGADVPFDIRREKNGDEEKGDQETGE